MAKKTTKNFAKVLKAMLDANPELAKAVEHERLHADIAEQILRLRTEAKLTQDELAKQVGTKQSVISRIEDADYYGHSLSMLERIADVFKKRLFVVFCTVGYTPTLYGRAAAAVATNTVAALTLETLLTNHVPPYPFTTRIQSLVPGEPEVAGSISAFTLPSM
jgi:transcriptional regulator with XRE-family HTH domain